MSMSVGAAASGAMSYLQSLLQQQGSAQDTKKTSSADPLSMLMQAMSGDTTAAAQSQSTAAATSSTGASCSPFSSGTMSALLSAQGQQPADSPSAKLFAKLDADGDGQVSKTEFSDAATEAGADSATVDAVFAKIDGDSDGAISQDELTAADQGGDRRIGGGGPPPPGGGAADGATTTSTTNADGSTTTTISYADGSTVTMTTAATQSGDTTSGDSADRSTGRSGNNNSAFNLLEQLIKQQSEMLTAATSATSTVSSIA